MTEGALGVDSENLSGALRLYARFDATVNGNGGGGADNAGHDDAVIDHSTGGPVPVSSDTNTATTAANRDYAQPVFAALRANRPFLAASSGYAGTPSDGLTQLDAQRQLTTTDEDAPAGNVVQTALVDTAHGKSVTLALGFGASQSAAVATAGSSAKSAFPATLSAYQKGWSSYDKGLNAPPQR